MKRIIYKIMACLVMLPFVSCETEDISQTIDGNDVITLELYTGVTGSRAAGDAVPDEDYEYAMKHLDVFIFNNATTDDNSNSSTDDEKTLFHYERIATSAAPTGKVSLSGKKRSQFEQTKYWVYVVANSTLESTSFSDATNGIKNLADLKTKVQEDENIHLSALKGLNVTVPEYFLMDGVAYVGTNEPNDAGTVQLYDGIPGNTTTLKVNLRRAAAKIVVELTAGNNVEFISNAKEGYYLRNMPTKAKLLAEAGNYEYGNNETMPISEKTVSNYSVWNIKNSTSDWTSDTDDNDKVTITTYVYSHSWKKEQLAYLKQGTSLVINIPLQYDNDLNDDNNTITQHDDSYYQIELGLLNGNTRELKRNHYYKITGKINAPGAEDTAEPIELQNLRFYAIDWNDVSVDVSGEKPAYLKVNKDTLRIYNQEIDESLVFASSSPINSITVYGEVTENNGVLEGKSNSKPYFYNKYNVKTELGNGTSGFAYWEKNSTNNNQGNGVNITAASKVSGAMSGNIIVDSTIPNNKTIRYFYLLIENEDGLKEKVFVEQYPVIYVTNQLGWYSYRSDFGSSYENKGNRYVSISLSGSGNYNWSWNGGYNYSTDAKSGFWYSKVETTRNLSGSSLDIDAYYWPENSQDNKATIESADPSGNNARIYHITVTATSDDYTIGRPRLTTIDGLKVTDPSADNAHLVSPSFMIASRLGVVTSTGGNLNRANDEQRLTIFRNHCANYVEVVQGIDGADDIVYDDWRLPTEAELKIIMDYQGTRNQDADAIDYLLNGAYYFGAAGPVFNTKNTAGNNNSFVQENINSTSKTVRCVRDAY